MIDRYAIINEAGNWLENIIVLNESDATGWSLEDGMILKKASDVDFTALAEKPE